MKKQKIILLLATSLLMICGGCSASSTKKTVPDSKVETDLSDIVTRHYGVHAEVIEKIDVTNIEHAPDTENHEDHIKAEINILMPYGESTWYLSNGHYIYFKSDDRWSGLSETRDIEAVTNFFNDKIIGHYDGYKELWGYDNKFMGHEYSIDVMNVNFDDMTIELTGNMDDEILQGTYPLNKNDGFISGIRATKYVPCYYFKQSLGNGFGGAIVISPCYGIEIKIINYGSSPSLWEEW